ncbi:unnamed protein product [Euphydryas editha]|uniref:TATA box-binding protein-associated factor RNA polymerase I subunit B n=1 Tax=Euphydryas editha TaxID=104508 RepID=A0AAU9UG21_EUPED|nr:unnamed protein product [Euphydryas editha]
MNSNPCNVCGGTDLNLVDGFYYCAECGTQDVNVRETIVEQNVFADGTFAHTTTKKLTTVLQEANEMSGEWNKWHAYNFILAGLTDELINLGAEQSVKTAVLWIWTKYIKMFQVKEVENGKSQFVDESLNENKNKEDGANTSDESNISKISKNRRKNKTDKFRRDIKIVTKGTLLTILYLALNLDRSDIQLSHLMRFIKEGRLSLSNCTKFVPEEINTKSIPHWRNFVLCQNEYTPKIIRTLAMTFLKRLDLGRPLLPDLNKMICNYIKELCLPNEFKNLVFALINLIPCDFLNLNTHNMKSLVRTPDYEGVCMSYVLVALKMCFGLDSEYELKVSDQVDRINYEENYLKSYKLGSYSEQTDRLFSFQEWYQFLLFRKTILCKYYLPMARLYKQPVDDCVLMEHFKERKTRTIKLSDNVTMDILNKITIETNTSVIPKSEFPATLTPMSSYTDVILKYLQDPDLRLLLSEDFSQYSLKYTINELNLSDNYENSNNIIQGISETNKCINPIIVGTLKSSKGNKTMVFVRNFENKHWLKTKPPTVDHVIKLNVNKSNSDKESDHGYDSNLESTPVKSHEITVKDETVKEDIEKKDEMVFEIIDEECEGICIFDDNFDDFENIQENKNKDTLIEANSMTEFHNDYENNVEELDFNGGSINTEEIFNPKTFDRESTIKKLLEMACMKYKIKIPEEKKLREPIKRKNIDEVNKSEIKRKKNNVHPAQNEPQATFTDILKLYYTTLENDILHKVSEEVKTVIYNQDNQEIVNDENFGNNDFGNLEMPSLDDDNSKNEECFNNEDIVNDKSASIISSIRPNLTINSTNSDTSAGDEGDLVIKSNPKFDVLTHDIEQLYVKLGDGIDFSYSVNYETDPQLDEIIDKSIENFANNEIKQKNKSNDTNSDTDSEDDIPLSEIANEKISLQEKINRSKAKYECLVSNPHIQKFNYWMRHYKSKAMTRSLDMHEKFDIEITENCPKSFVFVIRECAAILDCSTFNLYKCMQNLEEMLITFCD